MGANQGLIRLSRGVNRELTSSEISRGYLFITKDKAVQKILGKDFLVKIKNNDFENQNLDNSGRISIGKMCTQKLKNQEITISLEGSKIIVT